MMFRRLSAFSAVVLFFLACNPVGNGGEEGGDGLFLSLVSTGEIPLQFSEGDKALVDGEILCASGHDGAAAIEVSGNSVHTVLLPAEAFQEEGRLVLPPSQFFRGSGVSYPVPFHSESPAGKKAGEVGMAAMTGALTVSFSGGGEAGISSLYLECGIPLCGTFSVSDDGRLEPVESLCLNALCLDCSVAAATASDKFLLSLPEGEYSDARLRVCTKDGRACGYVLSAFEIFRGKTTAVELQFSPDIDLIYAEHFDRLVWGAEPFSGSPAYGPSTRTPAPASVTGLEPAWFAKPSALPGTVYFSEGASMLINPGYLAHRGLGFWKKADCCRERRGCLELGSADRTGASFDLTGIVPEGGVLSEGRLSFRIALSEGFTGDIVIDRIAGVVGKVCIDGEPVDIAVSASSHTLSVVKGSSDFLEHQTLRFGTELLPSGKWHDVNVYIAALCHASPIVFQIGTPAASNSAYIDDIRLYRTSAPLPDAVTPTDEPAPEGEDCSSLRLMTCAVNGLSDLRYIWNADYGMEYIDLTLASTSIFTVEDFTDASGKPRKGHGHYISLAAPLLESAGLKVWCIHMPYLDNLCLAHVDETLRRRAVERFISYIGAVSVLHPVNILFHAGANSRDTEAYSSEALLRSVLELQPHADAIGAHICIENLWKGVGSDPQELCAVVDEANLRGNPQKPTRIAFDSGHALLWCRLNGGTPIDCLRTFGTRVGTLHISSNHGTNDDHVFPGYGTAEGYGSETATWSELLAPYWGEFYSVLLSDCRYRGPWVYEVGTKDFDDASQGPKRFYTLGTPWFWTFNHDSYVYPAYQKFISGNLNVRSFSENKC